MYSIDHKFSDNGASRQEEAWTIPIIASQDTWRILLCLLHGSNPGLSLYFTVLLDTLIVYAPKCEQYLSVSANPASFDTQNIRPWFFQLSQKFSILVFSSKSADWLFGLVWINSPGIFFMRCSIFSTPAWAFSLSTDLLFAARRTSIVEAFGWRTESWPFSNGVPGYLWRLHTNWSINNWIRCGFRGKMLSKSQAIRVLGLRGVCSSGPIFPVVSQIILPHDR